MHNYNLEKRKFVIGGAAIVIVLIYILRLFALQIMSDDYKKNADSNAFLKKVQFPARGAIYGRNGRLMVYNQPAYDLMVVMREVNNLDTLDFCETLGITKEFFIKRMADIKNRALNPGYSRYTEQLFLSQLPAEEFAVFQEKLFTSSWYRTDAIPHLSLNGLNLDSVWENIITTVGNFSIQGENTLKEQIQQDEERAKLQRQIELLERRCRQEKQPRRKMELFIEIQKLRQSI